MKLPSIRALIKEKTDFITGIRGFVINCQILTNITMKAKNDKNAIIKKHILSYSGIKLISIVPVKGQL